MKKLLIALAVVVVLIIAVIVVVPFLVPVDTYKSQIGKAVQDATGRELAINGDVSLSIFPRLEVEANDVTFANAPGASEPMMASLDRLLVQLQLRPLLGGEVRVDSFALVEPVIHLEVDANGRGNWEFAEPADAAPADTPSAGGTGGGLKQLSLGDVRLERGRVTYADARSGASYDLSDVNMAVSLPSLDEPFSAEGSVTWNQQQVRLTVNAAKPRALLAGDQTAVELGVDSTPVTLSYDGTVATADPLRVDGTTKLNVPSVRELAAWTGTTLPLENNDALGPLAIDGTVTVNGRTVAFRKANLRLDDIVATGDVSLDAGGDTPAVNGRLDVEQLNLNPYLPPPSAEEEQQPAEAGPSEWSDEPIDLSALKSVNAVLALTVGSMQVREITFGRSALDVTLQDAVLTADLTELQMYEGTGKARIVVNGAGQTATVEQSLSLEGLQAEPFLTDAAGFKRLEGTGQMQIAVSTRGSSQRDFVRALNGTGDVKFVDGAIKGINLAAMVRNVQGAFLDKEARVAQKTDFAELSGTFTIANGILTNNDLKLLNPLLRLNGSGTVDIPQRTVNYRLVPRAVATTEGQGGQVDKEGLAVPVLVSGSWDNVKYAPDVKGIMTATLGDPSALLSGAAGGAAGGAAAGTTEGTQGTLDTTQQQGAAAADSAKEDSQNALDSVKEGGEKAWEGTKEGTKKAVEGVKGLFGR